MGKHLIDGLLQCSWCDWFANAAILIKTKQDKKRGTISNSIVITAKKESNLPCPPVRTEFSTLEYHLSSLRR